MTRDDPQHQQRGGGEAAANSSLAGGDYDGIILMETSEAESGIPLDAATTSSDAAVVLPPPTEYLRPNNNNSSARMGDNGGGGDGSSSSEQRQPSLSSSGAVDATAAALAGGQHYIHAHARRRHHRKRTSSKANSSGNLETNGSMAEDDENGRSGSNNHSGHHHHHLSSSGGSLMNSSTIGSNIMGGRAEHSIVSFGRNFNFDSTSSPSNSDSGEGAVHDGKGGGGEGSNSDDDSNNRNSKSGDDCVPSILHTNATSGGGGDMQKKLKKHHSHHRRGGGGDGNSNTAHNNNISNPSSKDGEINQSGGGNSGKKSKSKKSSSSKQNASVKLVPEAATAGSSCALQTTGEEESGSSSTSSGSDSSRNNDSGGSASGGSNSGNDGSSGGKSTISSLTTSSNQDWMASNEKGNIVGGVVAPVDAQISTSTGETVGAQSGNGHRGGSDGQLTKTSDVSGKKRKKSSSDVGPNEEDHKSEEDDDGYKTDEEQWGGNHLVDGLPTGCGPLVTHTGSSPKVPKATTASSVSKKISTGSVADPRTKQARFSVDHQHPKAVGSVDALTQPLSSLSGSDSAGNPGAVTNSSSSLSKSLAVDMTARSNARGVSESSSGGFVTKLNDHPIAHAGGVEPDKRMERNAREKERSCRIARQIDDLRALLSRGGVVVSKGTKSSVLAEAANYINVLQQQQVQWEMERQAMMQQMQQVRVIPNPIMKQSTLQQSANSMGPAGSGVIPQQMALTVQSSSIGQVGILPMTALPPPQAPPSASSAVTQNDYKFIFNNSSVGMAIASLGGAFIDCNSIFCQLSEYTKEEVCAMTIFNMTSRQDLQHAFDLISQMITPALDNGSEKGEDKSSIVLRGAMKKRSDLGLNISLIKGEHGIVKCFCVTLIRILSIKATRPDTVSIETELPQVWSTKQQKNVGFGSSPAYTSG